MADTAEVYGIVQMPDVLATINQDSAAQRHLLQMIFNLQDDPRPDGHTSREEYGPGFASLLCETTIPPYTILYRIDEGKRQVVVLAVYEKRWS